NSLAVIVMLGSLQGASAAWRKGRTLPVGPLSLVPTPSVRPHNLDATVRSGRKGRAPLRLPATGLSFKDAIRAARSRRTGRRRASTMTGQIEPRGPSLCGEVA